MFEKLQILRDGDEITACTWDSLGAQIAVKLTVEDKIKLAAILDKVKAIRPKWEQDVAKAREDVRQAQQATASAVEEKKIADQARDEAVARAVDLESQIQQANDKIAQLLTGSITDQATTELIMLYPELTEKDYGRSVDAGEAYRVGTILYIAKRDINGLTADTMPTGAEASTYWRGGGLETETPAPNPKYKYPAGTELEYQGVLYYATIDTNFGPEAGFPTWDLAENKPK